jgi:hypothetical protein
MRRCHLLILCATVLTACRGRERAPVRESAGVESTAAAEAAPTCEGARTPPVSTAGLGPVRLHERISMLPRTCTPRDTAFTREGTKERASIIRFGAHSLVALTTGTPDTSIKSIFITDSAFHTERGIGVRSSVGDLRRIYGRICAAVGEGAVVTYASQLPGVYFATSAKPPAEMRRAAGGRLSPSTIPDSARITRFWVADSASSCAGPEM